MARSLVRDSLYVKACDNQHACRPSLCDPAYGTLMTFDYLERLVRALPFAGRLRRSKSLRRSFGYEETLWTRKVADEETRRLVARLEPSGINALEISGTVWREFGFRSYRSVHTPPSIFVGRPCRSRSISSSPSTSSSMCWRRTRPAATSGRCFNPAAISSSSRRSSTRCTRTRTTAPAGPRRGSGICWRSAGFRSRPSPRGRGEIASASRRRCGASSGCSTGTCIR